MRIEGGIVSFFEWIPWAALKWLIVVAALAVIGVLLGYLVATLERGPRAGLRRTWSVLSTGVADILRISPRRVWALTRLAVKESIRRRVVVVVAVFILVLLFAGWYLDPSSPNPARLYLSFVLTATDYLVLAFALLVSAFSLPLDVRAKTLHTVVTKPVRPSEIVLGRIVGFTLIGTVLLVVMGGVSYLFVVLGLPHDHTVSYEDLQVVGQAVPGQPATRTGKTSRVHGHRHQAYVGPSGKGRTDVVQNHWHEVSVTGSGDQTRCEVGSPEGMLVARVPVYGKMVFRDRDGMDGEGISVGDEDAYRGYIAGGTMATLIWEFEGIRKERFPEERFPNGIPLEMTLGVFRTHKGNIEKGVYGSLAVRNPKTGLTVETGIFESKEFATKELWIPHKITRVAAAQVVQRRLETAEGTQVTPPPSETDPNLANRPQFDLFEDLVADGRMEIWVRCVEPGQYFGAAAPDLYLRAADAPFALNFAKGYLGIWLQMVLVIGFGVMFSTFLSGPIAMIATSGAVVGGFFVQFMSDLSRGQVHGGGPGEALVRLFTQENLFSELGSGLWIVIVQMIDRVAQIGLAVIASFLPAFGQFSYADYVANGFDVSGELVLIRTITAMAFLLPLSVVGYFFLKTREVAR